eukprot:1157133-Pelagomonas_calceolata.AAC.3
MKERVMEGFGEHPSPCDHHIPHRDQPSAVLHRHPRCARHFAAFAVHLLLLHPHQLVHPRLVPEGGSSAQGM